MRKGWQILTKMIKLIIWGREFSLPVEFDCYKGEKVTKEQMSALEVFISQEKWLEDSKKDVEIFCREKVLEDTENQKRDNIFSYVKPESIFVKRDKENPRVAIMCKYRYDPEHGLAVVFSYDGKVTVGIQDIIL